MSSMLILMMLTTGPSPGGLEAGATVELGAAKADFLGDFGDLGDFGELGDLGEFCVDEVRDSVRSGAVVLFEALKDEEDVDVGVESLESLELLFKRGDDSFVTFPDPFAGVSEVSLFFFLLEASSEGEDFLSFWAGSNIHSSLPVVLMVMVGILSDQMEV